jgi:hypothetical protein
MLPNFCIGGNLTPEFDEITQAYIKTWFHMACTIPEQPALFHFTLLCCCHKRNSTSSSVLKAGQAMCYAVIWMLLKSWKFSYMLRDGNTVQKFVFHHFIPLRYMNPFTKQLGH